jgi:hypothetical protein
MLSVGGDGGADGGSGLVFGPGKVGREGGLGAVLSAMTRRCCEEHVGTRGNAEREVVEYQVHAGVCDGLDGLRWTCLVSRWGVPSLRNPHTPCRSYTGHRTKLCKSFVQGSTGARVSVRGGCTRTLDDLGSGLAFPNSADRGSCFSSERRRQVFALPASLEAFGAGCLSTRAPGCKPGGDGWFCSGGGRQAAARRLILVAREELPGRAIMADAVYPVIQGELQRRHTENGLVRSEK